MMLFVAERALRDRRRGLLGWTVGIASYVGLMTAVYPSVRGSEVQRAIARYPNALKAFFGGSQAFNFASGAGYLNVELYSLVLPALLVILAIGYGTSTLAGEQQAGTLELLLANPLTRRRVVLEKLTGLAVTVVVPTTVSTATVLVVGTTADLGVSTANLIAASFGAALLATFMGILAMLIGAVTGSRPAAIGVPTTLFAASYLIVGLAGLVSWLKPARVVSPLYHANGTQPLQHGLPTGNYAVLVAITLAAAWLTVLGFDRRDLTR